MSEICPNTQIVSHFYHFFHHLKVKKKFKLISINIIQMTTMKKKIGIPVVLT